MGLETGDSKISTQQLDSSWWVCVRCKMTRKNIFKRTFWFFDSNLGFISVMLKGSTKILWIERHIFNWNNINFGSKWTQTFCLGREKLCIHIQAKFSFPVSSVQYCLQRKLMSCSSAAVAWEAAHQWARLNSPPLITVCIMYTPIVIDIRPSDILDLGLRLNLGL